MDQVPLNYLTKHEYLRLFLTCKLIFQQVKTFRFPSVIIYNF